MSYCQRGKDMIMDLKRSDWLPPYDEGGITVVVQEISALINSLKELSERKNDEYSSTNIDPNGPAKTYNMTCIKQNVKYLNSYISTRLRKISRLRMEVGPVLPEKIPHDTFSSLEIDYFAEYGNILGEYMSNVKLDLLSDVEPPKDFLIQIRVLKDCGEVMSENGSILLEKGRTYFLRRADMEGLIRQGLVEHIHSDEF